MGGLDLKTVKPRRNKAKIQILFIFLQKRLTNFLSVNLSNIIGL